MFAVILDWVDRQALRVDLRSGHGGIYPSPRWFLWAKFHTNDHDTGLEFYFYGLMIRFPSYEWGYCINTDDFGWRQHALVWRSRKTNQYAPPKGFSMQSVDALPRK